MNSMIDQDQFVWHFGERLKTNTGVQDKLFHNSQTKDIEKLIHEVHPKLYTTAIPFEQATRTAKHLIDSGCCENGLKWRFLRCSGGPLVLQIVCKSNQYAIWYLNA